MIDMGSSDLEAVKRILSQYVPHCEVRVFGSRINGTAKAYSDLDLVLIGRDKIDWRIIEKVKQAFSESDLPFMVDVLDWHVISQEFRGVIEKKNEIIQPRGAPNKRT